MDAKKLASLFDNPNFAKWFGDSKAVDDMGAPLVAYHRTHNDFDAFDPARIGSATDSGALGSGFYFTTDPKTYEKNAKEIKAHLSLKNPLRLELPNFRTEKLYHIADALGVDVSGLNKESSDAIRRAAMERGHDGVILDYAPTGYNQKEIVAFEPTQIKSTANSGTFNPNDPNIYKSALPYAVAGGGLMSMLSTSDAAAIESIRQKDAPLQDAWNPVEAFGGGLGGGLRAALAGIVPDGLTDWAINGLMSGGK